MKINLNLSLETISLASCDTVVEALCLTLKSDRISLYSWFGSILFWVDLNFSSFFGVILKDKNEQQRMDN